MSESAARHNGAGRAQGSHRASGFRKRSLQTLDVVQAVDSASDLEAAWADFSRRLEDVGFTDAYFAFGTPYDCRTPFSEVVGKQHLLGPVISPEWMRFLGEHPEFQAADPVAEHCRRSTLPYEWTARASLARLTPPQRHLNRLAHDHGMRRGISIPLHQVRGTQFGVLTVFGCDDPGAFDAALADGWADVFPAAYFFHGALEARGLLGREAVYPELSRRERECLLRVAQGMRTKVIAARWVSPTARSNTTWSRPFASSIRPPAPKPRPRQRCCG